MPGPSGSPEKWPFLPRTRLELCDYRDRPAVTLGLRQSICAQNLLQRMVCVFVVPLAPGNIEGEPSTSHLLPTLLSLGRKIHTITAKTIAISIHCKKSRDQSISTPVPLTGSGGLNNREYPAGRVIRAR